MNARVKTPTIINWTTDDRMIALLALGVENLDSGNDKMGRAYLGAMSKGISFRRLRLAEAMAKQPKKAARPAARKKAA